MLDTAITFNGIALSRTTLSLAGIVAQVQQQTSFWFCILGLSSVVGAPLLVAMLACAGAGLERYGHKEASERVLIYARTLSPWITADVFALSMITFLFAVQGNHLHTTIPDGTALGITTDWFSGFYVGLGMGAAGFSLKWKAVHYPHDDHDEDLKALAAVADGADYATVSMSDGNAPATFA